MNHFELYRCGVPWRLIDLFASAKPYKQRIMLKGLSLKTARIFKNTWKPRALRGTTHSRSVEDLRSHHLRQTQRHRRYALKDACSVAREARRALRKRRLQLIENFNIRSENGQETKVVPLPGGPIDIEPKKLREPKQPFTPQHSPLSCEVDPEEIPDQEIEWENCLDMVGSDHNKYIIDYHNEDVESETVFGDLIIEDPDDCEMDDYDIEMAKLEEDGVFDEPSEEEPERQTKRKQESAISRESLTSDLSGDIKRGEKRRKLEIGTSSSQILPPQQRKRAARGQGGKTNPSNLFRQANTLAAVFGEAIAVAAPGLSRKESSSPSSLDPLTVGFVGAEPSGSELVKEAAASLLDMKHGSSNVSELKQGDREASKEASGKSDELEPSGHTEEERLAVTTFPRTARSSERALVNKSLMRRHGYEKTFQWNPVKPSSTFKSFFATRRQRKNLLRKGEASWSEKDASFMRSGKEIAEPDASLGAEFVAKRLLDGRTSQLPKLVLDSAMSRDARKKRALSRPEVKPTSIRHQKMIAQMEKSGLNPKEAEPEGEEEESGLDASPSDSVPDYPLITVGSLMPEVEEELAKWEKEEEEEGKQKANHDNP